MYSHRVTDITTFENIWKQIEKVPRGIQGEKSSKDMARHEKF